MPSLGNGGTSASIPTYNRRPSKLWNASFEKKMLVFSIHKNALMKMSCYFGKMQKQRTFEIHFLDLFHNINSRFATVPSSLRKKPALLWARFPFRRDVCVMMITCYIPIYQVLQSDPLKVFKWPFFRLSDLPLVDWKGHFEERLGNASLT